jgi:LAO/AO transport system kinase
MNELISEMLQQKLNQNPAVNEQLPILEQKVINGETTPYLAAKKIIDLL